MNIRNLLVAGLLLPTLATAAESINYSVAHIRQQNTDMVVIPISPNFFNSDAPVQAKWYAAVKSCVRQKKLAGEPVVVSNFNGRYMFYGPKSWNGFMQSTNMKWVNARINKQITCTY